MQSQEELSQLRREKLKAEEKELLSLGEKHTHSSGTILFRNFIVNEKPSV